MWYAPWGTYVTSCSDVIPFVNSAVTLHKLSFLFHVGSVYLLLSPSQWCNVVQLVISLNIVTIPNKNTNYWYKTLKSTSVRCHTKFNQKHKTKRACCGRLDPKSVPGHFHALDSSRFSDNLKTECTFIFHLFDCLSSDLKLGNTEAMGLNTGC